MTDVQREKNLSSRVKFPFVNVCTFFVDVNVLD